MLGVKFIRPKWNPLLRSVAREIVLRKIRPVVRDRLVRADHSDAAGVSLTSQHFCGGIPRSARTDDDDRLNSAAGVASHRRRAICCGFLAGHTNAVAIALDNPY